MGDKVQGNLLIIGGAEDKAGDREILKEFTVLSGAEKAVVVIVTTATQVPEKAGKDYVRIFRELGCKNVEILDIDTRQKACLPSAEQMLGDATGIFFTGGDQLRITSTLGGTPANEAIKKAYLRGTVIAGTSAGASAMSSIMIVEGDSDEAPKLNTIKLAPGLGLFEEVVIDQHFAQRGRIGRLLSAVAHNPYIMGIGIDEDTAIVVRPNGRLEVIGSQTVTFLDGRQIKFTNVSELVSGQSLAINHVVLHVLPKGFGFDLAGRTPFKVENGKGVNHENT